VPTQDDVRRIALGLPGTTEDDAGFRFLVGGKGYAWAWLERQAPKRARVPNPDVLAVWTGSEDEKQALLDLDPAAFFTEPHYDGYPAVLVRLPQIDPELLARVLTDAWRLRSERPGRSRPRR
jgi:hypothetical protein